MRLEGAVALVTGGSSGIGRATALRLAGEGSVPILVGRDRTALGEVAAVTGGQAIVADLAEPGAAEDVAVRAVAAAGRVDLLVNNAGAGWAGALTDMTAADAERLVCLDLLVPVQLTRLLLPGMLERRHGHVVQVASIAGYTGIRDEAVYAAAKAGLVTFAESVRAAVAGSGVGVSVVAPGVVDTPFFTRRGSAYGRAWPRPIPAARVADALVRAVREDRAEVFVPAWMRLPARLRGGLPTLYRALAARFG